MNSFNFKKQFFDIFKEAFVGIYMVKNWKFIYINKAISEIFGYEIEEMVGKLGPLDLTHPDDRGMVKRSINMRLKGKKRHDHYVFKGLRKNGETIFCEVFGSLLVHEGSPAIAGVLIDITPKVESEIMVSEVVQRNPIPMFVIDEKHTVTHWNKAMEALTGIPKEEIVGTKNHWMAFYKKKKPLLADLIADGISEDKIRKFCGRSLESSSLIPNAYECEVLIKIPKKGERWLHFTASPIIGPSGKIKGAVETVLDITDKKKAELGLKWDLAVNSILSKIAHLLLSPTFTLIELGEEVLESALRLANAKHGFISVVDPDSEREVRLLFKGVDGEKCVDYIKGEVSFSKGPDGLYRGLWGHALNTKKAFLTNNPTSHKRSVGTPPWHLELKNFMSAPAVYADKVVGQIALANSNEGFNRTKLKALERIANLYALGVVRQRDLSLLRENEEKFRSLVTDVMEKSNLGIIILDQHARVIWASRAIEEFFSAPRENLLGKSAEDTLKLIQSVLENPERSASVILSSYKTQKYIKGLQLHVLKGDKRRERWLSYWSEPIRSGLYKGGRSEYYYDITEQKKTEDSLKETLAKLQDTLEKTIHAFASAIEKKDPYTAGHQKRVAQLAIEIAKEMGLSESSQRTVYFAGLVHDIGKISIPMEILSKPGRLNNAEFEVIKAHPQTGYEILKEIEFPWPIADIVLQHHERLDGSGYPLGLKNDEITLEARILAVADVVEAMASHRPYRPALGIDEALKEINEKKGILYDPDVVNACIKLFKEKGFNFSKD